jgi:hypothetical protein
VCNGLLQIVQAIDRGAIAAGDEMPTDIDRDLDGGMPHLVLHVYERLALLNYTDFENCRWLELL